MPTEPYDKIIPDPIINDEVLDVLKHFSEIIIEVRNFGSHVLKQSSDASSGGHEVYPLIMLFRNILEVLDAIALLMSGSSIEPCKILLRTFLENMLSIEYMTERDTEKRALCFLVSDIHKKIKNLRKIDPSLQEGKQFLSKKNKDRLTNKANWEGIEGITDGIRKYEKRLEKPHYVGIEKEYQKTRTKMKNPYWYSLFGGPRNLEMLADNLKLSGVYEEFYRHWSDSAHGTDIFDGKVSASTIPGEVLISQIRLPNNAQHLTQMAISLSLDVYQNLIKYFVPSMLNDYQNWYVNEIRQSYQNLGGDPIIEIN